MNTKVPAHSGSATPGTSTAGTTAVATGGASLSYRLTVETPDGPFTIIASTWETGDSAVIGSGWTTAESAILPLIATDLRPVETVPVSGLSEPPPIIAQAVKAVADYYAGDFTAPQRVPVVQHSGPFTQHAWQAMRAIRPGRPDSYADFAKRSGNAKAVRAAASACAKNSAALFVPCHRVVRTGGGVGNFRWGSQLKESLLARENTSGQ